MVASLAAALEARSPDDALQAMMKLKSTRSPPEVDGDDGLQFLTRIVGSSFQELFDESAEGAKGMYSELKSKFGAEAAQRECYVLLRSSAVDLMARCMSSSAETCITRSVDVAKTIRENTTCVNGLLEMASSKDMTECAAAARLLVWMADAEITRERFRNEQGLKLLGGMVARATRKDGRPVSSIERVTLLHSALTLIERAILPEEIHSGGGDPLAVLPNMEITQERKAVATWATVAGVTRAILDSLPIQKTMIEEDGLQPQTVAKALTILGFLGLVAPSKDAILQHPLFPFAIQPYLHSPVPELKRCAAIAMAPMGKDSLALRLCGGCGSKELRFAEYKRCARCKVCSPLGSRGAVLKLHTGCFLLLKRVPKEALGCWTSRSVLLSNALIPIAAVSE